MDINNFPKAKKILLNYFIKETIERNNNLEYKMFKIDDVETIEYLAERFLNGALKDSPRALFDVFDNNKLFIGIRAFVEELDGKEELEKFAYSINESWEIGYKTRKEAELDAIWEAIRFLENEKKN
jgi:hypothetical protein